MLNNSICLKQSNYNITEVREDQVYIANTISKAIIELSIDEWQLINQILEEPNNYKTLPQTEILYNNNLLVDKDENELKILEYNYWRAKFDKTTLNIGFIPTFGCNFKCPYCFEDEKALEISENDLSTFLKFETQYFKKYKTVAFNIFGGEALIRYDILLKVLQHNNQLVDTLGIEYNVHITTNGFLLEPEIVDELIDKYKVNGFQITIDANKITHDSLRTLKSGAPTFDKVLQNFKYLLTKNSGNLDIALRVQVLNNSVEDVDNFLSVFSTSEKEKFQIYFRPITKSTCFRIENQNKQNLEEFYLLARNAHFTIFASQYFQSFCPSDGGDENKIVVHPDLTVGKCLNRGFVNSKIGYIDETGVLRFNTTKIALWEKNNPFSDTKCRECIHLPTCFGGCPWQNNEFGKRSCFYEYKFNYIDFLLSQEISS